MPQRQSRVESRDSSISEVRMGASISCPHSSAIGRYVAGMDACGLPGRELASRTR